jgi:hypothetical protein
VVRVAVVIVWDFGGIDSAGLPKHMLLRVAALLSCICLPWCMLPAAALTKCVRSPTRWCMPFNSSGMETDDGAEVQGLGLRFLGVGFWGEYVTWTFLPNNNGIAHQGRAG